MHSTAAPSTSPAQVEQDERLPWAEAPAAGSAPRPRPTAFAPQRPSLLDGLLGSAIGEAAPRAAAMQLPPALPAAPRSAPGAPRRTGPLPPPPELPSDLLASLRPMHSMPAAVSLARGAGAGACGALADTAASAAAYGGGGGGGGAGALDALEQACAWLQAIARSQSSP